MIQTKWEPFVTVRAVSPVIVASESLGYSPDELLASCGIPRVILADADGKIPALGDDAVLAEGVGSHGR